MWTNPFNFKKIKQIVFANLFYWKLPILQCLIFICSRVVTPMFCREIPRFLCSLSSTFYCLHSMNLKSCSPAILSLTHLEPLQEMLIKGTNLMRVKAAQSFASIFWEWCSLQSSPNTVRLNDFLLGHGALCWHLLMAWGLNNFQEMLVFSLFSKNKNKKWRNKNHLCCVGSSNIDA